MEEAARTTISRLLQIAAGKTPIPHGVELVAQDVVVYMDGHTFRGINTWANWFSYLRARSRVSDLDVEVDDMVRNADGTITARGRWKARRQGEEIVSQEVWARYRVVDGIVTDIWTTRTNYVFIIGPIMNTRAGHLLTMLRVFFWARGAGGMDLRTSPALLSAPAPVLASCEESIGV